MSVVPYWEKALVLMQGDPTKLTRDELIEGQVVLVLTMKAAADEIVKLQNECKRLRLATVDAAMGRSKV